MRIKLVALAFILALATTIPALAGSFRLGGSGVPGDGSPVPFGVEQYTAFQQLFSGSLFTGSINIGGLTFFNNNSIDPSLSGVIAPSTYTIELGTVAAGTILGTDLNANLASAADLTSFFVGTLSGGVNGQFTIVSNQNNFNYDPTAGDLILDIRKPLESPTLTLGLDYTGNTPGMSTAYTNAPNPPIGLFDCAAGCLDNIALVTQFETAGQSQFVPYLPTVLNTGSFEFTDLPSGSWFDPATAWGFHYLAGTSGGSPSLFTTISFPTGFSAPFNLLDASNTLLGAFAGGASYTFSTPVTEFSITGISPLVDPTSPSAFPLQIGFSTATGSFTMDALFPPAPPDVSSVPEPASAFLAIIGLALMPVLAKRLTFSIQR